MIVRDHPKPIRGKGSSRGLARAIRGTADRAEIRDELGLVAALQWQCRRFQDYTGLECSFHTDLEELEVVPGSALDLALKQKRCGQDQQQTNGLQGGIVVLGSTECLGHELVSHPDGGSVTNWYYPTGLLQKTAGSRVYPVEYTYDAQGRMKTLKTWQNHAGGSGTATTTFTDNNADQLLTESYSGGTLNGRSLSNSYDGFLRRSTVAIKNGSTILQDVTYGYDTASRLQTVTDTSASAYTATYSYHPDSMLINTLSFRQSGADRLVTTRGYDKLNRLQSIASVASGTGAPALPIRYDYPYNTANQRTRVTEGNGSYWIYRYDELGQVIAGNKYWNDGTPVAGPPPTRLTRSTGAIKIVPSGRTTVSVNGIDDVDPVTSFPKGSASLLSPVVVSSEFSGGLLHDRSDLFAGL